MEESISSSRTTAFHGANSCYQYHQHQHQLPAPPPPPAAATATAASDFEDADAEGSGWTAYFLQLASDEEEDASASNKETKKLSGRGRASTVSKPNIDKDTKQVVEKKGVKKKTKDEVLHLVGTTIIVEEEEDPLQDTASSPLVQLNVNGGELQGLYDHHKLQRPATSAT